MNEENAVDVFHKAEGEDVTLENDGGDMYRNFLAPDMEENNFREEFQVKKMYTLAW